MRKKISFVSCIGDVADTHTLKYVNTLLEAGFEVETIRTGNSPQDNFIHHKLPEITSNFWPTGLTTLNLIIAVWQRFRNGFYLSLKLFKTRPAIVVATEPDCWFIAIFFKVFLRYKIIADIREVYEDRIMGFPKWIQKFGLYILTFIMKFSSRFTDEIIHVSEERKSVYNYLLKSGEVIVYYPDLEINTSEFINLERSEFIVIHAGSLREKYGANQIIEAFSNIAERKLPIKLLVLGGIAGKIKNLDLLHRLIEAGYVNVVKQVPYNDVVEFMRNSDVGLNIVLPVDQSHYLAQPRKLYEYLSQGLPFVAAKVPTIEQVAKKWNCGLVVDPYSPIEIANSLIYYYSNREERLSASKHARHAHEVEYNWQSQKNKFIELFNKFLIN